MYDPLSAHYQGHRRVANVPSIVATTTNTKDLPVSLEDLKSHLRIDTSQEDIRLTSYGWAAAKIVENYTGYALMSATYMQRQRFFDVFDGEIILRRYPVTAINSIKYYDTTGTLQTIDASNYRLMGSDICPAVIIPLVVAAGFMWPYTDGSSGSVGIEFVAGYSSVQNIPFEVNRAIKEIAAFFYENPQAVVLDRRMETLPDGIRGMLDQIRLFYEPSI